MIKFGQAAKFILGAGIIALVPSHFLWAQVPQATAPISAAPEELSKAKNEQSAKSAADAGKIKSLLFSDSDIETIRSARLFYENHSKGVSDGGIAEDDFLKNLEKIAAVKQSSTPTTFTYPQFFLSSIAYYSPDDWVIWVENEKITQNSGISASGLQVIGINKEKVTFEWKPERMDRIAETDYDPFNNPIDVDFIGNKVVFSLKANQTFTSYAMRVVEGKVPPVTISEKEDVAAKILAEPDHPVKQK